MIYNGSFSDASELSTDNKNGKSKSKSQSFSVASVDAQMHMTPNQLAMGLVGGGIEDAVVEGAERVIGEIEGKTAISNSVPKTFARAIPGKEGVVSNLGLPGETDSFVTDAEALRGLNAQQIANKLSISESDSFNVYEFSSENVAGISSPINRTDPGFVGRGQTAGGAPEFSISNGPMPADTVVRNVK